MNPARGPPRLWAMLDELPPPSRRPPPVVYALRAIGFGGMVFVLVATINTEPRPALHGTGLIVLVALILFLAGIATSITRGLLPRGVRFYGILAVAVSGIALAAAQPHGAAVGAIYYVFAIAELRMPRRIGLAASLLAVGGQVVAAQFAGSDLGAWGIIFSTVP